MSKFWRILAGIWMVIFLSGCPGSRNVTDGPKLASFGREFFEYNGLRMAWSPGNDELVTMKFVFVGGAENYPGELQGIERLALATLMNCIPDGYTNERFRDELEENSMRISTYTGLDASWVSLVCPKANWKPAFELFSRWFAHPDFTESAFRDARETLVLETKQEAANAAHTLNQRALAHAFSGKVYSRNPDGTPETLEKLTYDQVRDYYKGFLLQKCRSALVWSGKPDRESMVEQVLYNIDDLPTGNCSPLTEIFVTRDRNSLEIEERPLPQKMILGILPTPGGNHEDAAAIALAGQALEARLRDSLMGKNPLATALQVNYLPGKSGRLQIFMQSTTPNRCAATFATICRKIHLDGFSRAEIEPVQRIYYSQILFGFESGAERTRFAAEAFVYDAPEEWAAWPGRIRAASPEAVTEVFRKYATGIYWTLTGGSQGVDEPFFLMRLTP